MNRTMSRFSLKLIIAMVLVALFSYISGFRAEGIGTDTYRYINYFERVISGLSDARYEAGFIAFTEIVSKFTEDNNLYLLAMSGLITISLVSALIIAHKAIFGEHESVNLILFLGFLLSSNWYLTATSNAMRHGISLSILYVGIHILLFNRRYLISLFIILMSASFHQSIFLFIIFIPIFIFSTRTSVVVFSVAAAGYPLGLWEKVVYLASKISPIDLYSKIEDFSETGDLWVGFQLDFFMYTVAWPIIYFATSLLMVPTSKRRLVTIIRIYMILCMPYFVFGFSAFSNRFAFFAWLYLPILHYFAISNIKMSIYIRYLLTASIFIFGSIKYCLYFMGPIS